MENFSVLLSLYCKETDSFLRESLDSVFNQTIIPNEVILVEDGPLTPELYTTVKAYVDKYPQIKVVPLEKNGGLGAALNEGLKHCTNELVARMDTDDICKPNRFAKQIDYMQQHPDIDVCGCWIDEFIDSTTNVVSTRKLPENHDEIFQFGKSRNPINHPAVMFRKHAVLSVNSYQTFYLFEDYYLWARMLVKGLKFHNIQESLLFFRTSADMFKRRGGFKYACTEASFQWALYKIGYINLLYACKNIGIRFFIRIIPNRLRELIYKKLIRK